MGRYRLIPTVVDARQFTGGIEEAQKLTMWLKSKGYDSTYFPHRTHSNLALPERISFKKSGKDITFKDPVQALDKGDWLVKKGEEFKVVKEEDFNGKYEAV